VTTPLSGILVQQYQGTTLAELVDAIGEVMRVNLAESIAALGESWRLDAEGVWLDYLGQRIGLPRPLTATGDFFGFGDAGVGFDQAPFATRSTRHASQAGVADEIYRRLLLARARYITGAADGETVAAILVILYDSGRVEDDGTLVAVLHIPRGADATLHSVVQAVQDSIIPRPVGVSYTMMADL